MALRKSKGNMYSWVTHLYNPIRGCSHDCIYCYMKAVHRRTGYDLKPRFIQKELYIGLGADRTIFVCSTGDMFGAWVPDEWIKDVLEHCNRYPSNQYLFQSKNPGRFKDFFTKFPPYTILGTTIETTNEVYACYSKAPQPYMRALELTPYRNMKKMVSIEPIMDFDLREMIEWMQMIGPNLISIGADSKGHHLPEPPADKVTRLIHELSRFTAVKVKSNLKRLMQ